MSDRFRLTKRVAKAVGINETKALAAVNSVIEQMGLGLLRDGRIELRGIGVFRTEFKPKRIQTFHIWKKKTVYGGYTRVYFKPGKGLRVAVNGGRDYEWSETEKEQVRRGIYDRRRDQVRQQKGSGEAPGIKTTPKSWGDTRS